MGRVVSHTWDTEFSVFLEFTFQREILEINILLLIELSFYLVLLVKKKKKTNPAPNAGDKRETSSIPVSGRSPRGEQGNPV